MNCFISIAPAFLIDVLGQCPLISRQKHVTVFYRRGTLAAVSAILRPCVKVDINSGGLFPQHTRYEGYQITTTGTDHTDWISREISSPS